MMLATPTAPTRSETAPRPRKRLLSAPCASARAVSASDGWLTLDLVWRLRVGCGGEHRLDGSCLARHGADVDRRGVTVEPEVSLSRRESQPAPRRRSRERAQRVRVCPRGRTTCRRARCARADRCGRSRGVARLERREQRPAGAPLRALRKLPCAMVAPTARGNLEARRLDRQTVRVDCGMSGLL